MGCRSSTAAGRGSDDESGLPKPAPPTAANAASQPQNFVEGIVCRETDINDNEMKTFDLGDNGKILLVKQRGQFSAVGTKCSHYGAPLATGALGDGRVRCPWHGACFNLATGDIEDFPGLDSIPCFQVSVEDGQVKVRAKKSDLQSAKRTRVLARQDSNDERTFIVIGGGPSGATCVETLRQEGFTGRLVLVNKEPTLPYDRIKLSKAMMLDIGQLQLRPAAFYEQNGIETMLGLEASKVNGLEKEVFLSNGYRIKFDRAYLATGSEARKVDIPGADLKNVVTVRTVEDTAFIQEKLSKDLEVVVLGSSFIALEAAAYVVDKVAKVTVIGRDNVPLKPVFGEAIGRRIMELCEEKGVIFWMESGIKSCIGRNGVVNSVELANGEVMRADLLIMGVGTAFYTGFLQGSGIDLNPNGSISVNEYLQTNVSDIFAGGDIAHAPLFINGGERATIGHYGLAQYHGRIAALNMLGKQTALRTVPFFWSTLFGKSIRYAGYGKPVEIRVEGDLAELKFVAFHFNAEGRVIAVATCGRDPIAAQFAELLAQGRTLHKTDLDADPFAWTSN